MSSPAALAAAARPLDGRVVAQCSSTLAHALLRCTCAAYVIAGNNLEAGLGALVTKRLVGAHLAAKQAAAAAMQAQLEREQEVRLLQLVGWQELHVVLVLLA